MSKRVIDGEALWSSERIKKLEPEWFRGEVANLLPLSLCDGSFEADPHLVWSRVYAYLRPSITVENVRELLDALAQHGIIVAWKDTSGKVWAKWYGIDKPGRLPCPARLNQRPEKTGPKAPRGVLRALKFGKPMVSPWYTAGMPVVSPALVLAPAVGHGQVNAHAKAYVPVLASAFEASPPLIEDSPSPPPSRLDSGAGQDKEKAKSVTSSDLNVTAAQSCPARKFMDPKFTEEDRVSEVWKSVDFDPEKGIVNYENESRFRKVCATVYGEFRHEPLPVGSNIANLMARIAGRVFDLCKEEGFDVPRGWVRILGDARRSAKEDSLSRPL